MSLTLSASGCGACGLAQSVLNPTGESVGARLTAPKSAKAGDTITLDATGSEIDTGVGDPLCPEIVRFYLGPPGTLTNKTVDPKPIAVILKPTTNRVTEGDVSHCRLVDGKVQVKVPASHASQADFEVGVVVQALPNPGEQNPVEPVFSAAANGKMFVAPGQVDPGPGPANQAPVARFFARVDPAVEGGPIDLDARESFDRDGTISLYEWDLDGNGSFEVTERDPLTRVADAGPPGTRRITLRVTDNNGAAEDSTPLNQLVVASTAFTAGTFGSPLEVAVNTAFDVSVDNNVGGADVVALDTDNDGDFDDGLPSRDANPADPQPQFRGMQYGTGGWKRLRVLWKDNASSEDTVTTQLIRVTPFVNPAARIAEARATAGRGRTRLLATLTPTAVKPVRVRRVSLVQVGVAARGLILRGRLRGKVRARRGQRVPPGVRVLTKAVFAGTLDGTFPVRPDGGYGTPTGRGLLLARAPRHRRTTVCLRVTQRGTTRMRFTVLGATGKARGLRASGAFPALRLDARSLRTRSNRFAITVNTGRPKGLSRACRALTRHLPAPRR